MAKGGDPKILSHQAENLCTFEFDFEPLISPHSPPRPKDFTHTAGKTAPRTEPIFFTPLVAPTHGHLWNFEFKLFETFTNIS